MWCAARPARSGLPGHRQLVASAEPFEALDDEVLDPSQGFLVGRLDAQHQHIVGGAQDAPAPRREVDDPVGVGPVDAHPHLAQGLSVTPVLTSVITDAATVRAVTLAHRVGVAAQLHEIPAWAFSIDPGDRDNR